MPSAAILMLRSARRGASRSTHDGNAGSTENLHVLDDPDQLADGGDRFVEGGLFFAIERDFDDAFDTAGADHDRDADIEVFYPILTIEPRGGGQDPLLV